MGALCLVLVIVLTVVTVGPLASIWALNTLFGLAIPFTVKTWFAAMLLGLVIGGRRTKH
jgi:hypothetical protein